MSEIEKFAGALKELADDLLSASKKRPASTGQAASNTQQPAKKARADEPAPSKPSSSYQKLKQTNRSLKETVEQLREVNQLQGISEAQRASLVSAIMREGGLESTEPVAAAAASSSEEKNPPAQQQQQQPPAQQQQQQQQQHPYAELQQQQMQQQQQQEQDLSDPNTRRSYLAQMLGGAAGGGQGGPVAEARQALAQTLLQGLDQRLAAGEDPGLLGIAAMGMQQQQQAPGQADMQAAAQMLNEQYGTGAAQPGGN